MYIIVPHVSRPVSLGPPGFLQSSLGQKPWSTLRPSVFTVVHLVQSRYSMPTGSLLTAPPSPLPVKALPPLPLLLSRTSPIEEVWCQLWEARRYASSAWITRWSQPWFHVAITSSVLIVPPTYARVQMLFVLCACLRSHRPLSSAICDLMNFS